LRDEKVLGRQERASQVGRNGMRKDQKGNRHGFWGENKKIRLSGTE